MLQLDLMILVPAAFALLALASARFSGAAPKWFALAAIAGQGVLLAQIGLGRLLSGSRVVGATVPVEGSPRHGSGAAAASLPPQRFKGPHHLHSRCDW